MFPYLYESTGFKIGSYGVMLAIAYLVGRQIYLTNLQKSIKSQLNLEILVISLLVFGVLGAKLIYILKNPDKDHLLISGQGFSSQGALLAALIVLIVFSKFSKVKLHFLLDAAAPAAILAYAIARVGCFLSGDECWGIHSELPWAMSVAENAIHPTEPAGIKVHPAPLYEIIYSLAIWFYLNYINSKKSKPYTIFFSLLLLWGFCRFMVEFVSTNPTKILGMSGSQFGALVMFFSAVIFFTWEFFAKTKQLKTKTLQK